MKNFLLSAMMIASGIVAFAQSPTVVTAVSNCTVFRNFNTSNEGFSSPSIYSDANDVSFFWNSGGGNEVENSGLTVRNSSLISPIYFNSAPGEVTVGFSYTAPAGTEYRVRVVTGIIGSPSEILASTAVGPIYTALPGTSGSICLLLSDPDLTPGSAIRFEFTFRANQPGNIQFDDLALTVSAGPLPVTFEGFVARKNDDGTLKLIWNVGEEVNVKGYYVETSLNGVDFRNAGYVNASGNSIYSLDYPVKLLQTTYFRVRNIDFDGRGKYTAIIKVYTRDQQNSQIEIYPVPANDQVTLQHNKSTEHAVITLLSPEGKIVKQVEAVPNTLQTQVYINNLSKGVYIVRYDDGQSSVQSIKLIKN
jgi:hypothetical protein